MYWPRNIIFVSDSAYYCFVYRTVIIFNSNILRHILFLYNGITLKLYLDEADLCGISAIDSMALNDFSIKLRLKEFDSNTVGDDDKFS